MPTNIALEVLKEIYFQVMQIILQAVKTTTAEDKFLLIAYLHCLRSKGKHERKTSLLKYSGVIIAPVHKHFYPLPTCLKSIACLKFKIKKLLPLCSLPTFSGAPGHLGRGWAQNPYDPSSHPLLGIYQNSRSPS